MILGSCEIESNDKDTKDNKLTAYDLNETFIQLIPWTGLVVDSDSILLFKSTIDDLLMLTISEKK